MLGKACFFFGLVLVFGLQPLPGFAATAPAAGPQRDGQHDFDFNSGGWNTHIRRLQHPLSGSNDWTELNGTVVVNNIWGGKAQIEEIEADGPGGHFEGMTLFLYNPKVHQWGMYFASSSDGVVDQPGIGEFKDGRGEFYSHELYQGRAVLVRMAWSDIEADSHHVEQSFSVDGGQTWEPNFIGDLMRNNQAAAQATTPPVDATPQQHGFDWQTFAHSDAGVLSTPALIGEFKHGRGVFYDQEPYQGRAILVRFTFLSLNADSSRDEQAFSADGGKTWEVNWVNTETRKK